LSGITAGFILVGNGDDLSVRDVAPDDVDPVAIVTAASAADDGDAIVWHGNVSPVYV
jgi:hypothetical protein